MDNLAEILFWGMATFAAVLALVAALAKVCNVEPIKLIPWLLAAGFVVVLLGAILQNADRENTDRGGRLLHQLGASVVLSTFVLFVVLRRMGDAFMLPGPQRSPMLTVTRGTEPPPTSDASAVKRLRQIDACVFDGAAVTPAWIRTLLQMRNLSDLDLRSARLDASTISDLTQLTQLDRLRVSSVDFTIRQLRTLQVALPACRVEVDHGVPVDQLTPEGRVRPISEAPEAAAAATG